MSSSFRRTLDRTDLMGASDDEMDNLLASEEPAAILDDQSPTEDSSNLPDIHDGPEVVDFDDQIDYNTVSLPRSKSVRFQDESDDDDDVIQEANGASGSKSVLKNLRQQVNGINGKVRSNVSRLLNREEMYENLLDRSDHLNMAGEMYLQSSEMLKRKMIWRKRRTRLVLTALVIIFVFVAILLLVTKHHKEPHEE